MNEMKLPNSPTLIVVVCPGNHHGTGSALELGRDIKASGGTVEYLWLYGLPAADSQAFPQGSSIVKRLAKSRRSQIIPWFQEYGRVTLRELKNEDAAWAGTIPITLDELRYATPEGVDIGEATLSSLISHLREPRPNVAKYRKHVEGFWTAGAAVYSATLDFLQTHPEICSVVVFNGRHATMRPVVRAAEKSKRQVFTTEAGSTRDKYELFLGLRHDLESVILNVEESWNDPNLKTEEKNRIADEFFELRRCGRSRSDAERFTRHRKDNSMPAKWDRNRKNIAMFISSYDEFGACGDKWKFKDNVADQEDAIGKIASLLEKRDPNAVLWMRIHPNLRRIKNSQTRDLMALDRFSNIEIIAGDSEVDSYALSEQSDVVLTFGSTMGVEVCMQGKHSVVFGPSLQEGLNACTEVDTIQEAVEEILTGKYNPKHLHGVRKYGYYLSTSGKSFTDWNFGSFGNATYRGEPVIGNLFYHHWIRLRMMYHLWLERNQWARFGL